MQLNLYAAVLLFAFVQGIIYIALLLTRGYRESRFSDYFLAGLIAACCLHNLSWMLGFMGIHILGQEWWFLPQDVGFIFGPLVYFYLKTQLNTEYKWRRRDTLHFLPYFIYVSVHFTLFFMGPDAVNWWVNIFYNRFSLYLFVELIPENGSALAYLVASARMYRQYVQWLPNERSDAESIQFRWFKHFLWVVVVIACTAVGVWVLRIWVNLSYQEIWIQRALVAVGIYYISIAGYNQRQPRQLLFEPDPPPHSDVSAPEKAIPAPENIRDLDLWKEKIETVMREERLYLLPDLSLGQLAAALGTHATHLSNVINAAFGKNFNDYVNTFRVHTFQHKINDPSLQHLTLLAIAFECGFNSKSTFNRAVKRVTGQQPSELLRQLQ